MNDDHNPLVASAMYEGFAEQMPKMSQEQVAWVVSAMSAVMSNMRCDQTNHGMTVAATQFFGRIMKGSGHSPDAVSSRAVIIAQEATKRVQRHLRAALTNLAKMGAHLPPGG